MKIFLLTLTLFLGFNSSAAVTIPDFIPNVVDQAGHLKSNEVKLVNDMLMQIRNRSDIWGAVYLLQSLNGESLEEVSERAFKKWKLGDGKKDNGLLLVLVVGERKSRFEVGYGLEGELPDIIVLQALNERLRPLMRTGQTADAIISAFTFLAETITKTKTVSRIGTPFGGSNARTAAPVSMDIEALIAMARAAQKKAMAQRPVSNQLDLTDAEDYGFWSFLMFTLAIFLTGPISYLVLMKKGKSAAELYPRYRIDIARNLLNDSFSITSFSSIAFKIVMVIGPGLLIYIVATQIKEMTYFVAAFSALYLWDSIHTKISGFNSEGMKSFLNTLKTKSDGLLKNGHIRLNESRVYEYTESYFESQEYRRTSSFNGGSSSSSGSSSGSSSSSGGGSSGGGGASSGW